MTGFRRGSRLLLQAAGPRRSRKRETKMQARSGTGALAGFVRRAGQLAWEYRLAIVANLFLISPILIFDILLSAESGRGIDKLALFALPASVFLLLVVQGLFARLWVSHLLLFPFYCVVVAE